LKIKADFMNFIDENYFFLNFWGGPPPQKKILPKKNTYFLFINRFAFLLKISKEIRKIQCFLKFLFLLLISSKFLILHNS